MPDEKVKVKDKVSIKLMRKVSGVWTTVFDNNQKNKINKEVNKNVQ